MVRITKEGLISYDWNPRTQSYPEEPITSDSDVFACLKEPCAIGAGVTLGDIFRIVGGLPKLVDFMASYSWCRAVREFHEQALLPCSQDYDSALRYLEISIGVDLDGGDYEESLDFYGVGPEENGVTRYSVSLEPMNNLAHLPVMLKETITITKGVEVEVAKAPYSLTLLQVLDAIYDDISFHGGPEAKRAFSQMLLDQVRDIEAGTAKLVPWEPEEPTVQ